MVRKIDVYISLDHETDGPCAGLNNLLTFGAAAFTEEGELIEKKFYERITPLPYLAPNPDTMVWWRTQESGAYVEAFDTNLPGRLGPEPRKLRTTAFDAMLNFTAWLNWIKSEYGASRFIPLGWPAVFDFSFTNYYCHKFLGQNPLGYACLDIRSYIMGVFRKDGYYIMKEEEINKLLGEEYKSGLQEHFALDDAIRQGKLFFMVKNHHFNE